MLGAIEGVASTRKDAQGSRTLRTAGRRWRARILTPTRPDILARSLGALRSWGHTPPGAIAVAAITEPSRTAIVDERGALTFGALHSRTNALARALLALGVGEQSTVALMCRNHSGLIETTVACCKLGAHVLYLDPAVATDEIADAIAREDPAALIYDDEFSEVMLDLGVRRERIIACYDGQAPTRTPTLDQLISRFDAPVPKPPRRSSRALLLAAPGEGPGHEARYCPSCLSLPAALLGDLPLARAKTTVLAAPMCRPWGFSHLKLALRLRSTLVLRRHFDPSAALGDIEAHAASALVATPAMLERIVGLGRAALADRQTVSLRLIAVNGWAHPWVPDIPGSQRRDGGSPSAVRINGRWVRVDDWASSVTFA